MWYHLLRRQAEFIMDDNALAGIRILVTRAAGQAEKLTGRLLAHGASVEELALIEIKEPEDFADLDGCLSKLGNEGYDWLIFASANAVRYTVARAQTLQICLSEILLQSSVRTAVVGEATARAAAGFNLNVDFAPQKFVSDFLVKQFPDYPNLEGKRIFWPRTNIGREIIAEKFTEAGATVDCAIAYLTVTPQFSPAQAQNIVDRIRQGKIDIITLTSSQAAQNLAVLLQIGLGEENPGTIEVLLKNLKLAAIGPVTADTAKQYLGKIDVVADEHTMAGLTEALLASLKFKQKPFGQT
jgi:uroporphyrinogen-III synthase